MDGKAQFDDEIDKIKTYSMNDVRFTLSLQDEFDYLKLIAQVALINKDAADYMQGPMRKLPGFKPSGDLWEVVVWWETLQGTDFWYDIACKLEADNE